MRAFALTLIGVAFLLPNFALSQACAATAQNPYCDPPFADLICCPYPSVCYWQDRQQTPGCCAQGQVCGVSGGGDITPEPLPYPTTITAAPAPEVTETTTLDGGVVGTVTSGVVGVFSTVTSGAVGVYSTVTSAVGGTFATVSGLLVGRGAPRAELHKSVFIIPLLTMFWMFSGAMIFFQR